MKMPVRTAFGRHPRLAILGPLEARLQRFDLTILGGLNEGSWPRRRRHRSLVLAPMRTSLGLEQPERGIGLAAHDFAMLAAGPCVLLDPRPEGGRRAHHCLALAAAPDATDARAWSWKIGVWRRSWIMPASPRG